MSAFSDFYDKAKAEISKALTEDNLDKAVDLLDKLRKLADMAAAFPFTPPQARAVIPAVDAADTVADAVEAAVDRVTDESTPAAPVTSAAASSAASSGAAAGDLYDPTKSAEPVSPLVLSAVQSPSAPPPLACPVCGGTGINPEKPAQQCPGCAKK